MRMPRFRPARLALATTALALVGASVGAAPPALDTAGFARELDPCADFFDYVNGPWLARTELPASRPRIGSFDQLRMANDALLERALAELVARPELRTTPGLALIADYFASGMNETAIEAQGLAPLRPLLARIAALESRAQLPALLAELGRLQMAAPLHASVRADPKDTRRHVLGLSQAGLGLPDRDDYFRSDATTERVRGAYRRYAERLLAGAGLRADADALDALLAFETRLAEATKPRAELRDPNANYNPFDAAGLAGLAPGLDWAAYLDALTARGERGDTRGVARLIVGQPAFARRVAELAAAAPLETWRAYLALRVLDATANRLPKAFADAHFDYRDATISGLKAPAPRAERVILAIGGRTGREPLGMALGELYAARAFSPEAQRRAEALIGDVKASMRARIERLDWMSAPTKQKALEKLAAMAPKIGAPAQFPRFPGLALAADDYAGNFLRTAAWDGARQMNDLDRPVDRGRWTMAPHIVNASAGGLNEITFPAGILQPPFFDARADDAVNYGAIGMVIGHEITHHFDDSGRMFDAIGTLTDWWTPADAAAYRQRADKVAALYAGYEPVPGHRINGRLTLGENISDLSGLPIAFDALQAALARDRAAGRPAGRIDGYAPEQRFFLSNAVIWRVKARDESVINQLRTDPHSPGKFRVLGPMSNAPAFARAFACKNDSAMVAREPLSVW